VVPVLLGGSAMKESNEEGTLNLTEAHLNYILSIYEISKITADVSSCSIAKALGVSKPSVSAMLSALMSRHLLVKERYGKVYLTDDGYVIAMRLERNIKVLEEKIPLMEISFTDDEIRKLARVIAVTLSGEDFSGDREGIDHICWAPGRPFSD